MDEKKYTIGKQILREHDLEFVIDYEGEQFTLHLPTPLVKGEIEADIARRLGGMPRSSFPTNHVAMIEAASYVNNLIVPNKCPVWFESAWTCYDDVLIVTLYNGYLDFRGSFQKRLKQGEFRAGGEGGST